MLGIVVAAVRWGKTQVHLEGVSYKLGGLGNGRVAAYSFGGRQTLGSLGSQAPLVNHGPLDYMSALHK